MRVAPGLKLCVLLATLTLPIPSAAQSPSTSSPNSPPHIRKPALAPESGLDPGVVTNGVYRNKSLALACKIPEAWVLRTDEMNAREDSAKQVAEEKKAATAESNGAQGTPPASSLGSKVLFAAFSRPPEAKGEEINSSILIAAESASSYPGLTEAAQYFYPITEVAKAQGLAPDEDPYEVAIGTKTLVRGDFHKDVGSRVMHQSTLAMLVHGYAISITVIAGTDDEVEDLIDGLSFSASAK
jgi:hypothetical protein